MPDCAQNKKPSKRHSANVKYYERKSVYILNMDDRKSVGAKRADTFSIAM